ncbi:MAG: hypothetical protein KC613_17835, partial [Myxococcales bacterium]|nr:hypothetical protein [Myxococcales bacterium]
ILVLRAGGPPPPAYRLGEIGGAAQAVRGDRVAETQVFLPRSRITLTVLPEGEEPAAAPTLKVFVSAGDGPLAPGERVKVLAKDGAFRVQAEAGTLFGAEAGPKRLWVGLAADGAALDGAAGLAPAAARELAGVRWLEVPVDYRLVGP